MSETNSGEIVQDAADPKVVESSQSQTDLQTEEQMVPLSALKSERAQKQQKEQELQKKEYDIRVLRDHIALMQANQHQAPPKTAFNGMEDTDVVTVGELKGFAQEFERQYQLSIEELQMVQRFPDYQEVVTKYLPDILKDNPKIYDTLKKSQNHELAYFLAKNSEAYRNETKTKKINADAERIVQNSQSAGSLSSVGSSSSIAKLKRYKDMSDADFMKEVHRNMGCA